MAIRIYIVEDHETMREMLVDFLNLQSDLEVCGVAETAEAALKELEEADVDLVLVDMRLPGMSGTALTELIRNMRPGLPCVMLSGHTASAYVEAAMAVGARGYVLKGNPSEIPLAIRHVFEGGRYLSKEIQM